MKNEKRKAKDNIANRVLKFAMYLPESVKFIF